jgi:hypothetical protein
MIKISLIETFCKCHKVPGDTCPFIRTLRELKADWLADEMSEVREVPSDV